MFYLFSKIFYFLISPVSWSILCWTASVFLRQPQHRRRARRLGIGIFLVLTNGFLVKQVARAWEYPPTDIANMDVVYDVAVVMGGFSSTNTAPFDRLHLGDAGSRLINTVELYKQGKVKKILISSGATGITTERESESKSALRFLISVGISPQDVVLENRSRNTFENAHFTAAILRRDFPNGNFLLVTSGYHIRRSMGCFEKQGIRIMPFSTDLLDAKLDDEVFSQFFPQTRALQIWEVLVKEWVGMAVYRLAGYI